MTGRQPLQKPVLHTARSSASSFNNQYPLISLRSSSSCSSLLPCLPVTSIISCLFFNNVFYKAVPTQDVANPVSLPSFHCIVEYFSLPWLYVIPPLFSHKCPDQSSRSFSSTTFQNLSSISDIFSDVASFHRYTGCALNIAFYLIFPSIEIQFACEKSLLVKYCVSYHKLILLHAGHWRWLL